MNGNIVILKKKTNMVTLRTSNLREKPPPDDFFVSIPPKYLMLFTAITSSADSFASWATKEKKERTRDCTASK